MSCKLNITSANSKNQIDIAKMMALCGVKFTFITPNRGPRLNYDFDIFYPDGFKVCAEAKAKSEAAKPRAKGILGPLRHSSEQLPEDQPSVIFMKIPEKWFRDIELTEQLKRVANGYLNQSERIVSIKFYSPITQFTVEKTARWHAYIEVSNLKFSERDWTLFRDENVPEGGRPPWWVRIF
jgi:hypothetical protein